jgi:hypothetical protein
MLCRRQVAEVRPVLPEIRRAGGDMVIVGTGDPFAAQVFRDDLKIPDVEVFSDEPRAAFALAGFHRGITTLLRPQAIGNYLRAFLAGHRPKRKQGDALQQGGVLVVGPDGTVFYRYSSRAAGDHPDPLDLLAAVRTSESSATSGEALWKT